MKWLKGAKEGIIVAGEQGQGNSLKQLSNPEGLVVNENGDVFVADYFNNRVMCWPSDFRKKVMLLSVEMVKEKDQISYVVQPV